MTIMKKLMLATFIGSLLAGAGAAYAGSVDNTVVTFGTTSGLPYAKGTLRAVRNSSDSTQYIGCSRYAYDTGSSSIVCYAMRSDGSSRSCQTSNDQMMRVAETLNPAAYLYFVVNSDGSCNRVITALSSDDL